MVKLLANGFLHLTKVSELVLATPKLAKNIEQVAHSSPSRHSADGFGKYEISEHISTCFTCISKHLPIENQLTLLLKDVYAFSVKEIMLILDKTEGQVKYLLQSGRQTMTDIFDRRCALVNKNGICHQCSELNGWLNPKQEQQAAKMAIQMHREAATANKEELYALRTKLVSAIDPLKSAGHELQEVLMDCNRMAMKEDTFEAGN